MRVQSITILAMLLSSVYADEAQLLKREGNGVSRVLDKREDKKNKKHMAKGDKGTATNSPHHSAKTHKDNGKVEEKYEPEVEEVEMVEAIDSIEDEDEGDDEEEILEELEEVVEEVTEELVTVEAEIEEIEEEKVVGRFGAKSEKDDTDHDDDDDYIMSKSSKSPHHGGTDGNGRSSKTGKHSKGPSPSPTSRKPTTSKPGP